MPAEAPVNSVTARRDPEVQAENLPAACEVILTSTVMYAWSLSFHTQPCEISLLLLLISDWEKSPESRIR